jgi:hypothetical protein
MLAVMYPAEAVVGHVIITDSAAVLWIHSKVVSSIEMGNIIRIHATVRKSSISSTMIEGTLNDILTDCTLELLSKGICDAREAQRPNQHIQSV